MFSFYVTCSEENNRIFIGSTHPNWDAKTQGAINFTVKSVRTPDEKGVTGNFIVYNYDSNYKVILSRTYFNLYKSYLSYDIVGD